MEEEEMHIMDAARYLIFRGHEYEKIGITPIKLQKLLYLAQGWSFVWGDGELFPEEFEAWNRGPANKEIYETFRKYGWDDIPREEGDPCANESKKYLESLKTVLKEYGRYTEVELIEMTKGQRPWVFAFQLNDKHITNESIEQYFLSTY